MIAAPAMNPTRVAFERKSITNPSLQDPDRGVRNITSPLSKIYYVERDCLERCKWMGESP